MKKNGLLHPQLLTAIAELGHGDEFLVCDAGMPIGTQTRRIDLAYRAGAPPFVDVLAAIAADVVIERAIVASEMAPDLLAAIQRLLGCPVERIPHDDLRQRSRVSRFAVRTGEFTPYANVLLVAGVAF